MNNSIGPIPTTLPNSVILQIKKVLKDAGYSVRHIGISATLVEVYKEKKPSKIDSKCIRKRKVK